MNSFCQETCFKRKPYTKANSPETDVTHNSLRINVDENYGEDDYGDEDYVDDTVAEEKK